MSNFILSGQRITLIFALLGALSVSAQVNVNLLGQLTYSEDLSDIWGYHDSVSGKEYALVGVYDGLSVVDVSNPSSPVQVQFAAGAGSIWRDIKVWDHYAYVINETGGGLLICDLSGLPGSMPTYSWDGGIGYSSSHNIFIDENGIAYLCGSGGGTGTLFLDLTANPTNPPLVGSYTDRYVHDLFVRGDTMWTAEINDGIFSVHDVSDKSNLVFLASQATSSDFTHNIWVSDDGSHAFTTDEVSSAFVDAYDVSDLTDIQRVDQWQSNPGSNVIVHNTFVHGNFLVTAFYRDGVTITDVTYPGNMIQTGYYDTSPLSGDNFNGCWGAYPYLPSGNLLATDIEEGLFVLGPTYVQGAYLEGLITDSVSGMLLSGAQVELIAADADLATSNIVGEYATGTANAGTYDLLISRVGYNAKTVTGIVLTNGVVSAVDVELLPFASFSMNGTVLDSVTGMPVPNAHVLFESDASGTYSLTSDASGNFAVPSFYEGMYEVHAGKWTYQTKRVPALSLNASSGPVTIEINRGLYDDFIFDFDWTAVSSASTGFFERDEPVGTYSGFGTAVNPEEDVTNDFGVEAYITGNGGGGAGTDDVDDGVSTLLSPIFDLTGYGDPRISFSRWFYNGGGGGPGDDSLQVFLNNGTDEEMIELVLNGDFTESTWSSRDIRVSDFIAATNTMRFIVRVGDLGSGHLVEGGLDLWRVYDADVTGPPAAAINILNEPLCGGASAVEFEDLSSGNPVTWLWNFPGGSPAVSTEANPVINYSAAGEYDVTLTVYNGAGTSSQTFNSAVTISPLIELSGSVINSTTGSDGSATVVITGGTPPYLVSWNDPAEQDTETATGLGGGTYTATITDANGCTEEIILEVSGPANGISIVDGLEISLGSNPFVNQTLIFWNADQSAGTSISWTAWDALGRKVDEGELNGRSGSSQIGNSWPAGSILVEFRSDSQFAGSVRMIKY